MVPIDHLARHMVLQSCILSTIGRLAVEDSVIKVIALTRNLKGILPMPPRESYEYWEQFMSTVIDVLGGPEEAVRKLAEKGLDPIKLAIFILGGKTSAAKGMGLSRQQLYNRLKRPIETWRYDQIQELSRITGIPTEWLTKKAAVPATAKPAPKPTRRRKGTVQDT